MKKCDGSEQQRARMSNPKGRQERPNADAAFSLSIETGEAAPNEVQIVLNCLWVFRHRAQCLKARLHMHTIQT